MLALGMVENNSQSRSRFNHAIKLTIRERDKLELERLSESLDMDPRQLGRISLLRGLQLVAKHGIDIRPEHIEGQTD
jgi:hypothetical protein